MLTYTEYFNYRYYKSKKNMSLGGFFLYIALFIWMAFQTNYCINNNEKLWYLPFIASCCWLGMIIYYALNYMKYNKMLKPYNKEDICEAEKLYNRK